MARMSPLPAPCIKNASPSRYDGDAREVCELSHRRAIPPAWSLYTSPAGQHSPPLFNVLARYRAGPA